MTKAQLVMLSYRSFSMTVGNGFEVEGFGPNQQVGREKIERLSILCKSWASNPVNFYSSQSEWMHVWQGALKLNVGSEPLLKLIHKAAKTCFKIGKNAIPRIRGLTSAVMREPACIYIRNWLMSDRSFQVGLCCAMLLCCCVSTLWVSADRDHKL